jgi:hypothetical protein
VLSTGFSLSYTGKYRAVGEITKRSFTDHKVEEKEEYVFIVGRRYAGFYEKK